MKYNEIEQDIEVKESNQDVIESDCVGEECYYRMPLDYLQDKRIQADLRLYFYLCNYGNSRGTDIVEVSIETMMKRIGITNRKIIFQTLDKLKKRGDIEIVGKRGNIRTIKVRSEKYSLQSENSYSELTNELARTNQESENSYSELTNELVETNQELVRTNQSNSENPCKSLENSTLQTLPEKPNKYYNNYNKNYSPQTPQGAEEYFSDVEIMPFDTKTEETKETKKENTPTNFNIDEWLDDVEIGKTGTVVEPKRTDIPTSVSDNKEKKTSDNTFNDYDAGTKIPTLSRNSFPELSDEELAKLLVSAFKDDEYIPKGIVYKWTKHFSEIETPLKKEVNKHNFYARRKERMGKWDEGSLYDVNLNAVHYIMDEIGDIYYSQHNPKDKSLISKEMSDIMVENLVKIYRKADELRSIYPSEFSTAIYQLNKEYNHGNIEHYKITV